MLLWLCIADINTCWPHLKRKVAQGEYLSTTDDFYDQLKDIMDDIHMAQSPEMADMLIELAGEILEPQFPKHPKLRTLWNSYFVEPWNCWSLGQNMTTPLNISNNQPIESWHKQGVMRVLKKALKGATAAVLEHSFPKIVYRDGIMQYLCASHSITMNLSS